MNRIERSDDPVPEPALHRVFECGGTVRLLNPPDAPAPYLSRSVLRAVREKREPVLAGNTAAMPTDVQVSMAASIMPVANIACPLTRAADW